VTLGPDSIRVNWTDNATDEQFYRVERSGDGTTFAQVAILSANSTSWTNTGLLAATTYTYRVRASAGAVYSPYSTTAMATTSAPPADPGGLTVTVLGPDSLRLNWVDNATNEQYYRVERSLDGLTFSQVGFLGANQTTWTNGLLTPSTTYFYRVRASAGTVYSGYSNVAFATTAPPPAPPSNLALSLVSASSVKLTWEDNATGEQYYRVERSTDGVTFLQVAILGANSTSWTNSSLSNNTTYWYRVRASQGSVYSDYSNIAQITTGGP
jgi:phosphodiesterase/alkaline phosphatase D-like protein